MLPAQGAELRDFALIFIELLAQKIARSDAIDRIQRLAAREIRNLELADRTAEHQRDTILVVQMSSK
jgi:hypothetical protein